MYPTRPRYISREDMETYRKTALINRRLNGDTSTVEPKVGTNSTVARGQITGEVKAASGLYDNSGKPLNDSVHFHFDDYVTIITGKKPKEMFNADSMYIYDLPLETPYRKEYTYRTGLVLSKKNRGTLFFMLFFTDRGKRHEQKYINMLGKHVWYRQDFIQHDVK